MPEQTNPLSLKQAKALKLPADIQHDIRSRFT